MKEIVTTNYFWGQDVEMSQFYRVPKALYTGEYFRGISFEAKAIYGMMIDRVSLSIKNGWLDEDGKTYIHYSVADIMADTGCGKNKILKCLKELEEDVHLIERKKQGQGRPDMIYVKNFAIEEVEEAVEKDSEVCNVNLKEFTTQTSRSPECKPLEVYDVNPNNTENNNTNINYINPILSIYTEDVIDGMDEYQAYSEIIRENIDMDSLVQRYPYEQKDVQEIYDLIVETVVGKGGSMTISGQQYPRELVKSRFLKLNMSHVEYVMECLRKNTTKVYNIKAYLLAALFNAGTTMSNYYRAEVNHDMPQFAG